MILKKIYIHFFLVMAVFLIAVVGHAQETSGTLNGTVYDAAGQP